MLSFGLLILYSASSITAEMDPRIGSSLHFVLRQLGWAAVAVTAMMLLKRTDYRKFQNPAVAFGVHRRRDGLLIAVYFVDAQNHRWLRLKGPFGVQPSELAKPALVVFLAFFVTWRGRAINNAPLHASSSGDGGRAGDSAGGGSRPGNRGSPGCSGRGDFLRRRSRMAVCDDCGAIAAVGVVLCIVLSPYRLARVVKFSIRR